MSTSIEALAFSKMVEAVAEAIDSSSREEPFEFLQSLHEAGFMVVAIPPPEPIEAPVDEQAVMIPALESGFAEWLDEVTAAGGKVNLANAGEMREWRKYWQSGVPAHNAKDMFEMPF